MGQSIGNMVSGASKGFGNVGWRPGIKANPNAPALPGFRPQQGVPLPRPISDYNPQHLRMAPNAMPQQRPGGLPLPFNMRQQQVRPTQAAIPRGGQVPGMAQAKPMPQQAMKQEMPEAAFEPKQITSAANAIKSQMPEPLRPMLQPPKQDMKQTLNPKYGDMFASIGGKYGVNPRLLNQMARVESRFNPRASAGSSSAKGMFQFIDGTWEQYAPKLKSEGYPLDRYNPEASTAAAAMYLNDNRNYLESKLGRPVQDHELYIAHNLGAGGARKLLGADPKTPLSRVISPRVAKNNPLFFRGSRTVGDALEKYREHLGL